MKIEQNVTLPPIASYVSKYPFAKMSPGDSFLIPLSADPKKAKRKRLTISCLMAYHAPSMQAAASSMVFACGASREAP